MSAGSADRGVEEITLKSWRDYFELAVDRFSKAPAYAYRGQADYEWPLLSRLDRLERRYPKRKNLNKGAPDYFTCPPFDEETHLRAFRNAIRGRRGAAAEKLEDDQLWQLGQHHGLATPLLDWTRSPWVALYFAFEEEHCHVTSDTWAEPQNRGVYCLSSSVLPPDKEGLSSPAFLECNLESNYRLISQAALLLRLPRQTDMEHWVRERFVGDAGDAKHRELFGHDFQQASLIKIKIPNKDRHDCLVALSRMNINRMTLFPDVDGAAGHVNSLWQPGHDDLIAYL